MRKLKINLISLFNKEKGFFFFQIGLFLLPSSAFLSGLFLTTALIFSLYITRKNFFLDYWNYPLLITSLIMFSGCLISKTGWLGWIGLANWIPFFLCFWSFQPYLLTAKARKISSLSLIAGTFPVVVTGLGQLWLGWEGPWQIFDGLIIWFLSPGGNPLGRFSGLFDYANIAGAWLALVWPFCLAGLIESFLNKRYRVLFLIISFFIVLSLILTDSRNAWGGLVLAIPLVVGVSSWLWLLPLMFVFALPILLAVLPGIEFSIQSFARNIVPDALWMRLNDMKFADSRSLDSTRLNQWKIATQLITQRPYLGWGAAAFSVVYPLRTGFSIGHAHNLPLELAVSHGIFVSLIINIFVLALLICALRQAINLNLFHYSLFDRAWWTAVFILVCFYATDIPLFDSRVNMAGWILLSGLRCMLFSVKNIK